MKNTDRTKNFWSHGLGAKIYRKFSGRKFLKMHQKIAEQILLRNPKNILDIACGPGDFLLYLSKIAPKVELIGTDIAPGMVTYASKKLLGKATILESHNETKPFPENSFDIITIMMAFHHFPKKLETLQICRKLLRQDGVLIIADIVAKSNFQKKIWDIAERFALVGGHIEHYTESDIQQLAEQSGFILSLEKIEGTPKRYFSCKFLKK